MLKQTATCFRNLSISIALLLGCSASYAEAGVEWTLDAKQSTINFVSVKAGDVGEAHQFSTFAGQISDTGALNIAIDLASVDTKIQIRDERMRDLLFKVADFPQAQLQAQIDPATYENIAIGESKVMQVRGTLSLHGQSQNVFATLKATRINENKALVSTTEPIILNAGGFGLSEGLNTLREIAGLPSISLAVPVTVALTFVR